MRSISKLVKDTVNKVPNRYVGNILSWMGLLYVPLDNEVPLREAVYKAWRRPLSGHVGWLHVLGAVALFLVIVLIATGVLLTFHYEPSHETARESVLYIMTEVAAGWLVRGIHHWASELLIVLVLVHVARTFFARAFRGDRAANWYVGMVILAIIVGLQFTGEILPWDADAYWRSVRANELGQPIPVWGSVLTRVTGGSDPSNMTLVRYFALHAIILPWCLFYILAFHLRLVRRKGIAPPQRTNSPREQTNEVGMIVLRNDADEDDVGRIVANVTSLGASTRVFRGTEKILLHTENCTRQMVQELALDPIVEEIVPLTSAARGRAFFPVHLFRIICAVLLAGGMLILLAAYFAPIVGPAADPFVRPASVHVKWYFIWFEQIRDLLPVGMAFVASILFIAFPIVATLWPLLDRQKNGGARLPWLTPLTGIITFGTFAILTYLGVRS